MKTALLMPIILLGCTSQRPALPKISTKEIRYCIHNGYSTWQPICKNIISTNMGTVLTGCEAGQEHDFDIINPTNVTGC